MLGNFSKVPMLISSRAGTQIQTHPVPKLMPLDLCAPHLLEVEVGCFTSLSPISLELPLGVDTPPFSLPLVFSILTFGTLVKSYLYRRQFVHQLLTLLLRFCFLGYFS